MTKKSAKPKIKKVQKANKEKKHESDEDQFDFGGFPKGISLKKNLGCGG